MFLLHFHLFRENILVMKFNAGFNYVNENKSQRLAVEVYCACIKTLFLSNSSPLCSLCTFLLFPFDTLNPFNTLTKILCG
jgi:hypothetical protein